VGTYYRDIDAGDLDRALAPFAQDCVYERQGHGTIRGEAALSRFYRSERSIETGSHRLEQVLAHGDWVCVRGEFAGVLKTGEEVTLPFTDWFRVRDHTIVYRQSLFARRAV
jgi:ketosteroid isomerase-like protein